MTASPRCTVCKQAIARPSPGALGDFPFCSQRCKAIDLGRWLDGGYAIVEDPWVDELQLGDDPDDRDRPR